MSTLPRKKSIAKAGLTPPKRITRSTRQPRSTNAWTRVRLDYEKMEAAKFLVDTVVIKDIPKSEKSKGYRKEVRVAVMPWSDAGYIDIRNYIQGNPTGQGVLVHMEKYPQFVQAVIQAEREALKMLEQGLIRRYGTPKENLHDRD